MIGQDILYQGNKLGLYFLETYKSQVPWPILNVK